MISEAHGLRGHLNLLLLAALECGPLHVAAIRQAVSQGSGGRLELSEGNVYPGLRRLEHLGLVAASWTVVGHKHVHTYLLTAAGLEKLNADRRAWHDFADALSAVVGPVSRQDPPESTETSPGS
jgi:PadR family transcriptional regulator PadR